MDGKSFCVEGFLTIIVAQMEESTRTALSGLPGTRPSHFATVKARAIGPNGGGPPGYAVLHLQ